MKDRYFSHDFYARLDPKLVRLRHQGGLEAYGFYWLLVEIMQENEGEPIDAAPEILKHQMQISAKKIKKFLRILAENQLIFQKNGRILSDSVQKRSKKRKETREKALENIKKRWSKTKDNKTLTDTGVLLAQPASSNTSKVKKSKVKKSKVKYNIYVPFSEFSENDKQVLFKNGFCQGEVDYWQNDLKEFYVSSKAQTKKGTIKKQYQHYDFAKMAINNRRNWKLEKNLIWLEALGRYGYAPPGVPKSFRQQEQEQRKKRSDENLKAWGLDPDVVEAAFKTEGEL